MIRRFEFVGGSSLKFWKFDLVDCDFTVRYGRLGSFGQSQTKSFADPAAARQHAEKLIEQKLAKGYYEAACVEANWLGAEVL